MNEIKNFETELLNINENIKEKYSYIFNMSKDEFHKNILEKTGNIIKLKKLSKDELKKSGVLLGIDGSTNRIGGAYPHYIDFFKALGKSTDGREEVLERIYSPVINDEDLSKEFLLSEIELDTAISSIDKIKPDIIMMDGGLIRYKINNAEKYKELKVLCEEKGVILFGVIKDIKTDIIARNFNFSSNTFDREILYGRFDIGEGLIIHNAINKKYNQADVVSAFMRTSNAASVIGIDILESQASELENISNLTYTLTPENSRGVPVWLDIVDKEVKITDNYIKTTLEEFLDRDIYERFFISERDRRTL